MISINLTADSSMLQRLAGKKEVLIEALKQKLDLLHNQMKDKIQGEKLGGQVLNRVTGELSGSVRVEPATYAGDLISGAIAVGGGSASHAVVHEYGGSHSYMIYPVNKKVLYFIQDGKARFAKSVNHPPLRERSFMRSTQQEEKDALIVELQRTVTEVANQ